MNPKAIVATRPCGCVAHVLPSFRVKEDCAGLELNGMSVEVIPFEGAGLKKCGPCEHGSTQQQLAALVKKQAGEIKELTARLTEVIKTRRDCFESDRESNALYEAVQLLERLKKGNTP